MERSYSIVGVIKLHKIKIRGKSLSKVAMVNMTMRVIMTIVKNEMMIVIMLMMISLLILILIQILIL